MNVLLVSPYRGAMLELAGVKMQPLGISYVGAALKGAGHDVKIVLLEDPTTLPDFAGADVVGISCNTVQFNSALTVAEVAKGLGKTVVMGGPHPTGSPEEALNSGFVDYVVRGEGEWTSVELFEGLNSNGHFDAGRILGLSWIDEGSHRVLHNPDRPFIQNLDDIPFPLRDVNWQRSNKSKTNSNGVTEYPLITSRGCPYNCKFCDVGNLAGRHFRTRSVENVVKEIEEVVTCGNAENILIADDIVNYDNSRLVELFGALIEHGLPVVHWVMGRGDHLIEHPETAEIMAKGGVRQMFLGIESPTERVLKAYKKGGKASSDVSVKAVELLRRNDIETWGAFLLGEPSETIQDIERTIQFAKFLNPGVAEFSILTPYPGTGLWNEVEAKITDRNWDHYDAMHSVFQTAHIPSKELEKMLVKAYMGFYRQPKRILGELFRKGHYGKADLKTIFKILKALRTVFQHGENPNQQGL